MDESNTEALLGPTGILIVDSSGTEMLVGTADAETMLGSADAEIELGPSDAETVHDRGTGHHRRGDA
ncbi:hypothetical protein AcW1_007256 [Taiwanofungus camphoratus]|nr:hypothetical protein AcW1_007256 [Antrodia cinnamomea]